MMLKIAFMPSSLICGAAVVSLLAFSSPVMAATLTLPQDHASGFIMVNAGNAAGAESFVNTMAKKGIEFLGRTDQSQTQKTESFRRLLEDNFDMETIGRFTLGRYWKTATPEQRTTYQRLFKKRIIDIYSGRFSEYNGQTFKTNGARADGDKDFIVASNIVAAGQPNVLVEWRVRNNGGKFRVVDVIVEGVSMSLTQRSDFSAVIQRGGGDIQALIDHLGKAPQ